MFFFVNRECFEEKGSKIILVDSYVVETIAFVTYCSHILKEHKESIKINIKEETLQG